MRKERKVIAIGRIQLNEGQLDWLPKNPRQWTQTDIDKTAASIIEDPDFLEDRPLLVVPLGKEFVAFGGNLRHEGCKAAKKPTAPCMVYFPETEEDYATIKRRAMKDNGSFGSWDFDELANNWDTLPLGDWGVPSWPAPENSIQGEGNPAPENQNQDEGTAKTEPSQCSRAAIEGAICSETFTYSVKVELPTLKEQLAFLEEMQGRGYAASVI